jgi:hypothetical protein
MQSLKEQQSDRGEWLDHGAARRALDLPKSGHVVGGGSVRTAALAIAVSTQPGRTSATSPQRSEIGAAVGKLVVMKTKKADGVQRAKRLAEKPTKEHLYATSGIDDFLRLIRVDEKRSMILVSAAQLDERLEHLLALHFVNDQKVRDELLGADRPLGTFSSRINTCYLLGLISADVRHALHVIREIRNLAAHDHRSGLLSEPENRQRLDSVRLFQGPQNKGTVMNHQARYALLVYILDMWLAVTASKAGRTSPRIDKGMPWTIDIKVFDRWFLTQTELE